MDDTEAIALHVKCDQRDLSMLVRSSLAQDPTRLTYPVLAAVLLVLIPTVVAAAWRASGAAFSGVALHVLLSGLGSLGFAWAGLHFYRRWTHRLGCVQARMFTEGLDLVFDQEGILTRESCRNWLLPWQEVTEIEAPPAHLQFSISPWGGFPRQPVIVPRHIFPTFETSEAFAAKMRGFRETADLRPLPGARAAPDLPPGELVFTLDDDTGPADYFEGDGRSRWEWDTGIYLAVVVALMYNFPLAVLRQHAPEAAWVAMGAATACIAVSWRHVSRGPVLADGSIDPSVMWISREGVVRRSNVTGAWGRVSWGWVHEVKVEPHRIVLAGPDGMVLVIPKRILRDAYQESAVVAAANEWIDAHRAAETAKAGI